MRLGEERIGSVTPDPYELRVKGVGNLALGGIIADVHLATYDPDNGITVARGDQKLELEAEFGTPPAAARPPTKGGAGDAPKKK